MTTDNERSAQRIRSVYGELAKRGTFLSDAPDEWQSLMVRAMNQDLLEIGQGNEVGSPDRLKNIGRATFLKMYIDGEDEGTLQQFVRNREWTDQSHEDRVKLIVNFYLDELAKLKQTIPLPDEVKRSQLTDINYDPARTALFAVNGGLLVLDSPQSRQELVNIVLRRYLDENQEGDERVIDDVEAIIEFLYKKSNESSRTYDKAVEAIVRATRNGQKQYIVAPTDIPGSTNRAKTKEDSVTDAKPVEPQPKVPIKPTDTPPKKIVARNTQSRQTKALKDLPPVERSRQELSRKIDVAEEQNILTKSQAAVLKQQLEIPSKDSVLPSRRKEFLDEVAAKVEARKLELLTKRLSGNRPPQTTGVLSLAVGRPKDSISAIDRRHLLMHPTIVGRAKLAKVDPNVVLDKFIENDLAWLSHPTS